MLPETMLKPLDGPTEGHVPDVDAWLDFGTNTEVGTGNQESQLKKLRLTDLI